MRLVRRASIALVAILVLVIAPVAQAASYSNTGAININDAAPATPYPSTITVSGVTNAVTDLNVKINGFSHTWTSDVDVLLVGPLGQTVMLMSDAGSSNASSGVNLTVDDQAPLPFTDAPIVSGSYQPTNIATDPICPDDLFATPAPSGPYGTTLAAFNGLDPNGTWSLFVRDDCGLDVGMISGGWALEIRSCLLPEVVALTDQTPAGPIVASLLCT